MTNSLTTVPTSVPTSNSIASSSSTMSVPRRFALAAAAVVGLATVSIVTVSAVRGDTGTDRPTDVPWTLQPEEAAFITQPASTAPAVTTPECGLAGISLTLVAAGDDERAAVLFAHSMGVAQNPYLSIICRPALADVGERLAPEPLEAAVERSFWRRGEGAGRVMMTGAFRGAVANQQPSA